MEQQKHSTLADEITRYWPKKAPAGAECQTCPDLPNGSASLVSAGTAMCFDCAHATDGSPEAWTIALDAWESGQTLEQAIRDAGIQDRITAGVLAALERGLTSGFVAFDADGTGGAWYSDGSIVRAAYRVHLSDACSGERRTMATNVERARSLVREMRRRRVV